MELETAKRNINEIGQELANEQNIRHQTEERLEQQSLEFKQKYEKMKAELEGQCQQMAAELEENRKELTDVKRKAKVAISQANSAMMEFFGAKEANAPANPTPTEEEIK